jgi:hypothetical protein
MIELYQALLDVFVHSQMKVLLLYRTLLSNEVTMAADATSLPNFSPAALPR